MTVYFVLAIILVIWGLALSIIGLLRADFPPSGPAGRALVGVTVLITAGTLAALLVTTEREHPREEAAAEAAEREEAREAGQEAAPPPEGGAREKDAGEPGGPAERGAKRVEVVEKEFSIELEDGGSLEPGRYAFAVRNEGRIEHDLVIEGGGLEDARTELIDGGESDELEAGLKRGRYRFYCSVPGHAEAGMELAVTVE